MLEVESLAPQKLPQDSTHNKAYIVAARSDGFGERMCAMLNAMAISKLSGLEFRFSWINQAATENLNNNQVLMPYANFPTKQELFSEEFILKYDIGDSYHTLVGLYQFYLERLKQKEGIVYIHQDFLKILDVETQVYRATLAECFLKIPFTKKIQNLIDFAKNKAQNFQERFVAIHIRGGDFVYQPSFSITLGNTKATNIYLALEIARLELEAGNCIVIFSDDLAAAQAFKEILATKGRVYSIDDFFIRAEFLGYEQSLFEILFMSFAEKIYSGNSGFSRAAAMIGNKPRIFIYDHFTNEQKIQIIHDYFLKFQSHFPKPQSALALTQLFIYGCNLNMDKNYLSSCAQSAYNLYPKTPYDILCIFALLQNAEYAKANALLEWSYNHRHEFLKTLLVKHKNKFVFDYSFAHYFTNLDIISHPYTTYFAFRIAAAIYPLNAQDKIEIPNIQFILTFISDIEIITRFLIYAQENGKFQEIYPLLNQIKQNLESFESFANNNL